MVRTKADSSSVKVCAAKAPRKVVSSGGGSSSSGASPCRSGSSKDKYSGGNPYNPQPIPNWQKGISAFFKSEPSNPVEESPKNTSSESETSLKDESPQSSESPRKESGSSTSLSQNGVISDDED